MKLRFRWLAHLIATMAMSASLLAQSSPTPPNPEKRHPKSAATSPSQQDVQALRDLLQSQQKQIDSQSHQVQQLQDQLHQVLDAVQQANANSQKLASGAQATAAQAQQSAVAAQTAAAEASKNAASAASATSLLEKENKKEQTQLNSLADLSGRFRFTGDIRLRGESYSQTGTQDRDRARIRIRLGLEGQLNQDFIGGVAIATGSQGDPTTTNETLTNVFARKTIALDKGYIAYNPVAHNWLSLTGGKFPYLWQRTSVTGDPDLNPEGFDQKVSFNYKGAIQNLTVQTFELLYSENSSGQDSYVLGGQASTKFEVGPWSATASFLTEHWNRPDAILQASAFAVSATTTGSKTAGPFNVPGEGPGCSKGFVLPAFAPCAFAPNGMTNATTVDASGKAHFFSNFDLADFILNNTVKTGAARFPVNLLLEFEDNLDARPHPLDSTAKIISSIGSQNKEYGGDISLGQTKNKNDFQFGYSWYRQEQDSVLASIAESDQRAPTNILQNKIYGNWKIRPNAVANITWWRGRVLNSNLENNAALFNNWGGATSTITTPGQQEPWLNRLQFDLVYTY